MPKTLKISAWISIIVLSVLRVSAQDISIDFCPVTKIQAGKEWSATLTMTNNTGEVLNFKDGTLNFDWQNLESLPYPFTSWNKNGKDVSFSIEGVGNWKSELAVGATWSKQFNAAKFSGVLSFPTTGSFTYNGKTYTIGVKHCSKTEPYELYDAKVEFNRDCFIHSPTSNMCLGEGATEIWQGEGVFDVMFPQDRPSWAIGTMVAHRLFTNLAGVEMLSPNFWTATAMNESRMTCDPTIVPDQINHWKINGMANSGNGIDNRTDNCFQVLNIGYTQIENNQPDLFGQTNQYGTASYSTVIAGGRYETGALAVTAYHYQDIRYWNQIFCWNANKFHKEAQDPYAIEKVFYHAFHDGPNAGIQLLNDIDANYNAAVNATDMHDVISTGGTWANLGGGSSRKVANFTSLLDGGDGHKYNSQYVDGTQEYYGCYDEAIKWSDILYYLDKIKILYPDLMQAGIQADIKAVFDGLNGGADVMFSNLGPVIDEIVIQMGGHDPSGYLATQYGASKVCNESPLGVSLRTNDTICPGTEGALEVWLAGDKNYAVDLKFPDGSIHSYTNIDQSPFTIMVDQPGDYEVVYFEDADEVGDINCNFANVTVESKNGSLVGWDKTNVDVGGTGCASGDLVVTKDGDESITISYTKDGVAQTDIVMGVNETSKVIAAGADAGEYIITTMSPNSCGTPINDTITFCGSCVKPQIEILTPDTTICEGDTAYVRFEMTGTADYDLYFKLDGVPASVTDITTDFVVVPVGIGVTLSLDSLVDSTCKNDTITNSITITVNAIPEPNLGNDTTVCAGPVTFDANVSGNGITYEWNDGSTNQTLDANATGDYWVIATSGSCSDTDSVSLTIGGELDIQLGNDTAICADEASFVLSVANYATIAWKDDIGGTGAAVDFNVTADATVDVHVIDADGCEGRDTIEVTINDMPVVDLGNDTSICAAAGALTLDAGNPGLTFAWEPNSETTQTIDVTTTGEYKVEVTENGCSTRDSIEVTVLGAVVLDLGKDTTLCSDLGALTLDANAGFDSYSWDNGATTQTIDVSASGTYDVEVEDAAGCIARDTIEVTINQTPDVDLGGDASICPTSPDVTFDAGNAGATYLWSSGETTQTIDKGNADAGDYSVIVTLDGCIGKDTITLEVSTELAVDLGDDIEICVGTDTLLDAGFGNGYTFVWNGVFPAGSQTFTATDGEVIVVVSDAGGCTGSDTIQITEVNPLAISLGNDVAICKGDAAVDFALVSGRTDVTVVGWNDASTDFTLTTDVGGEYWVEVDSAGCTARDTAVLTVNDLPLVSLGNDTFLCKGTTPTITLDAGTFVSYQWADVTNSLPLGTNATQNVSAIGVYGVIVVDTNNCINGDSLEVTEEIGTSYTLGGDTTICPAGSATFTVPNGMQTAIGASWEWLNDASTGADFVVDNQVDGNVINVILEYSNEFGCISNDTVKVTVDNTLPITALRDTALCEGEGVIFLSGYPATGYTYTWHDGSTSNTFSFTDVISSDAGTVQVDIVSAEGCSGSATADLTVNLNPIPVLTDGSICVGQKTILDHGLANVTTLWSPTNETTQSIEVTVAGTYTATVTDANNCSADTSAELVVNMPPTVSLGPDRILCDGDVSSLTTGFDDVDYSNAWNQMSTATVGTIDVTQSGDYGVVVTDIATGCSDGDTIKFTFNVVPDLDLGNDVSICEGEEFTIQSNETDPAFIYSWTTGATTTDITVNTTNTYTLTVINGGCNDQDDITVTVHPLPVSELMDDTILCFEDLDDGLNLDPGRVGVDFLWGTGITTQVLNTTQSGTYIVDITSAEGCSITDQVTIKEDCPASVWLPTGFTIDGNGLNETWEIKGRGVETVEVLVFNRWGELIWTGNNIGDFWDGTYGKTGNAVQQDVYVYKLTYSYLNVNEHLKSKTRVGTVALIR